MKNLLAEGQKMPENAREVVGERGIGVIDIEDMRYFADKHRGKYKKSGPHWSLVNRFPVLFDGYERALVQIKKLRAELFERPFPEEVTALRREVLNLEARLDEATVLIEKLAPVYGVRVDKLCWYCASHVNEDHADGCPFAEAREWLIKNNKQKE